MQRFGMGGGHGGPDMHMQANFRRGMGFGQHRFERMLEEIDATPGQEEKLKAIRDKFLDGLRPIMLGLVCTLNDVDKAEKLRAALVAAFDEASQADDGAARRRRGADARADGEACRILGLAGTRW